MLHSHNLLQMIVGLAYLHESCNPKIIHMDVKSSNILMTENLEGKMSDSRLNSSDGGIQVTTKLVGSRGYVDPEYVLQSLHI